MTVTTVGGTSATSPADQFTYVAAPTVTGVSPSSGPESAGTLVTITGTGFNGATAVDFGTTPATDVTVVSDTSITADSPAGTGAVDVTVITVGGTSAMSPADQFTYVAAPTVTGINPSSGPEIAGTLVTITGTGFNGATAVDFGTIPATDVTVVSATSITADSPAGTGAVDVTVTTVGGTSATLPADQFTYVAAPTVTGINPSSGPEIAGTLVTITGTGFNGATAVDFGTIPATDVTVVSATSITADSPAGTGAVDVTVTTVGGTSATSAADQFTYVAAPAVTALSPSSGPESAGTLVTITGTGFNGATAVDFGTKPATDVTVVSDTSITADSPAGTGVVDVTVTTVGGTSATAAADQFTYLPPTITVSTGSLNLGTTTAGKDGMEESYAISGADLTANVVVTAPTGVQLSDDVGSTWNSSLTLTESGGAVMNTSIEARISATAMAGSVTGSISSTSTGATTQKVAVSGTVKAQTLPGTIASSLPQSTYGEAVTITVTFSAPAVGSAPMTGTVAFFDGATYLGTAPLVDPPVSGTASLSLSSLAIGSHTITAVYSGDANYSSSTTTIPLSIQVVPAVTSDGPQVTSVLHFGNHAQKSYLLIYFNGPLDPAPAENTANYTIVGPVNKHGHGSRRIKVGSAIYDPATNSVTLRLIKRLNVNKCYILTIDATTPTGVTNPSGMLLDGAGTGRPGSNYVTMITRKNFAGGARKLPTIGRGTAARTQAATAKTSTQHVQATLHKAAVDHLLETGLLRVPRHRARP